MGTGRLKAEHRGSALGKQTDRNKEKGEVQAVARKRLKAQEQTEAGGGDAKVGEPECRE